MIEMVIVISVIAIVAISVFPKDASVKLGLAAQTQALASDIRYTQSLAMTHGQRYRLNRLSATTYNITTTSGTVVQHPITGGTITLGNGITLSTALPNNLIAFDGKGIPYTDSSATTALASSGTFTLTAGSKTCQITITPETGRVSTSCT